jgi:hypothetical protein
MAAHGGLTITQKRQKMKFACEPPKPCKSSLIDETREGKGPNTLATPQLEKI